MGLAQAPGPLVKGPIAAGRLQALLTPFAVSTPGVFLYYPDRRQVLPKLRVFIEHARSRSAEALVGQTAGETSRKSDEPGL